MRDINDRLVNEYAPSLTGLHRQVELESQASCDSWVSALAGLEGRTLPDVLWRLQGETVWWGSGSGGGSGSGSQERRL